MNKLRAQKRASTQHFIHQLSSTLFSCTKLILIHRLSIKKNISCQPMLNHKLPPSPVSRLTSDGNFIFYGWVKYTRLESPWGAINHLLKFHFHKVSISRAIVIKFEFRQAKRKKRVFLSSSSRSSVKWDSRWCQRLKESRLEFNEHQIKVIIASNFQRVMLKG